MAFQDRRNTMMKTMTMTATMLVALAIAVVATISSGAADRTMDGTQVSSQTAMPINELTANARNLSEQSFDYF
jgi:hypothetical protein